MMPRLGQRFKPSAERLESHVLLSMAASAGVLPTAPITETLTTDRTIYKVGQPIRMTLTETNNTGATVSVPNITGGNGFTATRNFKIVWASGARRPGAGSPTLEPGESRTVNAVWNGRSNVGSGSRGAPLTGTFEIDNTLATNSVTIAIDPRHGKGSTAGVTSSVPMNTLTLTG